MKYGAIVITTGIFTKQNEPKVLVADRGTIHTKQIIQNLMKSGFEDIVVVTGVHKETIGNSFKSFPIQEVDCKDNAFSLLTAVRSGIHQLGQEHDRICVYPIGTTLVSAETLCRLKTMKEDIVLPYSEKGDMLPFFVSLSTARWFQLYNGKRGIEDAMRNLVMIGSVSLRKVRIDIQRENEEKRSNYKSVINWI